MNRSNRFRDANESLKAPAKFYKEVCASVIKHLRVESNYS